MTPRFTAPPHCLSMTTSSPRLPVPGVRTHPRARATRRPRQRCPHRSSSWGPAHLAASSAVDYRSPRALGTVTGMTVLMVENVDAHHAQVSLRVQRSSSHPSTRATACASTASVTWRVSCGSSMHRWTATTWSSSIEQLSAERSAAGHASARRWPQAPRARCEQFAPTVHGRLWRMLTSGGLERCVRRGGAGRQGHGCRRLRQGR